MPEAPNHPRESHFEPPAFVDIANQEDHYYTDDLEHGKAKFLPPLEIQPVPVTIIEEASTLLRERMASTYQTPVARGTTQQIVSQRESRKYLLIKNTHASVTVYFGFESNVATFTGFPLAAGAAIEMWHERPVFILNPDTSNDVTIAIYTEFIVSVVR